MTFRAGDAVMITYDGRTVPGTITLASPNGVSLMLAFDALLGGHVGMMPVLGDGRGNYASLIEQRPVKIERVQ